MVMAALSLSRLFSQSIAGTALWRPLFCGGGTQIRRNARHRTTTLLAVSERSNLISSDFQLSTSSSLPQRSNRVRGRASSGDKEPGGSASVTTSLASEAAGFVYSGMDHLLLWCSQFESIFRVNVAIVVKGSCQFHDVNWIPIESTIFLGDSIE